MPVVWQHGLGADRSQPAEVFPHSPAVGRITLECRGHGASALGDPEKLAMATFAEDVVALLDHLDIARAVVGGISLGAAVALRVAASHADRVAALILARPACSPRPHRRRFGSIARLPSRSPTTAPTKVPAGSKARRSSPKSRRPPLTMQPRFAASSGAPIRHRPSPSCGGYPWTDPA